MITREEILEALRDVEDPEVHRSIVELDMVKRIDIDGNNVFVEVTLTIRGCPLHTTIENAVRDRLAKITGIENLEVTMGFMTDEERARFAEKVRGKQQDASSAPILADDKNVVFIAVASGKGGVGKSTVTANLAKAIGDLGLRVGLVDADIYGFSIPGIYGVKDAAPTVIDNLILPVEVGNVRLISTSFFVPDNNPVVWRGPMLGKMLRNFFAQVHWGDLDVMLLDLPPGTGDIALDVHQLLPKSKEIIVTTPQVDAADVAVRAGLMGLRTNHEILGVVENMAYYECGACGERAYLFGRGGGDAVAEALETEVVLRVPMADMSQARGALFDEASPQGQAYAQLAKRVVEAVGLIATSTGA